MSINILDGPLAALREQEIELITDIATTLAEIGDQTATDRQRLQEVAQDLRDMFFIVAVIGEFNSGKSTFVNALIGEELLPMGITPTTEYIELIRYNEVPNRKPVIRQDGLREWAHPNTGAVGVALVDTPGTGSVFEKHEATAKSFLHRSDLVIFVISAKHAFAETERLYLEMANEYGKKIILVVNQIDLLAADERSEVRRFLENQVRQLLNLEPLIFMVSAKQALDSDESAAAISGDDTGLSGIRAHLRGVYEETPPTKQKLIAQLETTTNILKQHLANVKQKSDLVSSDITKVRDVQKELQQQSLGLATQMREASASIDTILEGVRKRGLNFIDANLSVRKLRRATDRDKLQNEFQEVVIGRSLRDINDATTDYINAVVDQSRLYWRGVIDRLNKLRDLMEQELSGLDSGVYAEQRESLQDAIRIAEAELKSYSSGKVIGDMQQTFNTNISNFRNFSIASVGGILAVVLALAAPGPLLGAAAAPLAMPAFVIGGAAALIFGVPAIRSYRKITRETKDSFNERVDQLTASYHTALDDLTAKERNRLTQYGNQILTPIFSRLEVLAKRYNDQHTKLNNYQDKINNLREEIEAQ